MNLVMPNFKFTDIEDKTKQNPLFFNLKIVS